MPRWCPNQASLSEPKIINWRPALAATGAHGNDVLGCRQGLVAKWVCNTSATLWSMIYRDSHPLHQQSDLGRFPSGDEHDLLQKPHAPTENACGDYPAEDRDCRPLLHTADPGDGRVTVK